MANSHRLDVTEIEDMQHPALQPFRQLHGFRGFQHDQDGACFVCEGRFLVERALQSHSEGALRVRTVIGTESALESLAPLLDERVRVFSVPHKRFMEEVVGYSFHRGVLASVSIPAGASEQEVVRANRLVVIPRLDGADNLGLILRSAAALGVDAVLYGKGPELYDRRVVRVSMGGAWVVPSLQHDDPLALLSRWRENDAECKGEVVSAALAEDAESSYSWRPSARCALVLGTEGPGLDRKWLNASDRKIMIPMCRSMDSLNVASSAAILMHQMMAI